MPLQFNMLHVLPSANIPVERLPLDTFVANQLAQVKKRDRINSKDSMYRPPDESTLTARER